ncbi:MAG TPA: proline--tRNA ligase [Nitrososphaeraceae archaeon]|nr:proline--tRNA ligase [Nitrososphaeraceae archaeon]
MKIQKEYGITARKGDNLSDWYSQVLLKTDLVDYGPSKGFIVLKPYGYSIWESIKQIVDVRLKNSGHQNAYIPSVIPESLLRKEEVHFSGFNSEVFWITKAGDNSLPEKLALRPTSEAIAYYLFSNWIASYKDLPLKLNFWNSAMRAEIKSTKPFIRNSEFLWQEGHTVHTNYKEAESEVRFILDLYEEILADYLAVPALKGTKTRKEKFVGALATTTLEGMMPDGKALQLATSHNLGQNFSVPFEIKYLGSDNLEHFAWQTSWGISWRLIGAFIMVHGDDRGLVIPPKIAPIQVVIVPIYKKEQSNQNVIPKSTELASELTKAGIRVHLDTRDEITAGWKYNDWEKKGVPLRISIGPKEISNGELEIVRRDTLEKETISQISLVKRVIELLDLVHTSLLKKANEALESRTTKASSYHELKEMVQKQVGFVSAGWCGDEECEISIKDETGADIRLIPFESNNTWNSEVRCVYCGKKAETVAVFAKAY